MRKILRRFFLSETSGSVGDIGDLGNLPAPDPPLPHWRLPLSRFRHRLSFFFFAARGLSAVGIVRQESEKKKLYGEIASELTGSSGDRASAHKHERLHNVARLLRPLPAAFRVTVSANAAKPRSSVRGSRSASSSHPPRFSGDGL